MGKYISTMQRNARVSRPIRCLPPKQGSHDESLGKYCRHRDELEKDFETKASEQIEAKVERRFERSGHHSEAEPSSERLDSGARRFRGN